MRSCLLVTVMLLVGPVIAGASADTDIRLHFTVEEGGDDRYYHADLENASRPAEILITYGLFNNTLYIAEENVRNVTLYLGGILADIPGTLIDGVETYFRAMGSLKLIVMGNGTDRFTIVGVPEVFAAYLDGNHWNGYSYDNGTVTFVLDMSSHDIVLEFEEVDEFDVLFLVLVVIVFIASIGVAAMLMRRFR